MTMASDPDQIRRRIEHTRNDLSANVNALTERLTPSRAVARRVDRTRQTLTNVKDKIIGTADDAVSVESIKSAAHDAASTVTAESRAAMDQVSDRVGQAKRNVSSPGQR